MDVRHLRCFLAVGEHLNFTRASRHVCLTQSAVSYQISALESELGVKLFDRAPHSVHFTPAGRHFYDRVREILASYEGAVIDTRRIASGATGIMSIGFLGAVESRFLPLFIRRFRMKHPDITLRIEHFDLAPLCGSLANGDLDVAFTLALGLPFQAELQTRVLAREPLVIVMPADHPLAGREALAYRDLVDECFVELVQPLNAPAHTRLVEVCRRQGFTPHTIERFLGLDALFLAVETGVGIAVFPKYLAEARAKERLTIVPICGEDSTVDCVVAWHANTPNPAVSAFIRELGVL